MKQKMNDLTKSLCDAVTSNIDGSHNQEIDDIIDIHKMMMSKNKANLALSTIATVEAWFTIEIPSCNLSDDGPFFSFSSRDFLFNPNIVALAVYRKDIYCLRKLKAAGFNLFEDSNCISSSAKESWRAAHKGPQGPSDFFKGPNLSIKLPMVALASQTGNNHLLTFLLHNGLNANEALLLEKNISAARYYNDRVGALKHKTEYKTTEEITISALCIAIIKNNIQQARLLLEHGANLEEKFSVMSRKDRYQKIESSPLLLATLETAKCSSEIFALFLDYSYDTSQLFSVEDGQINLITLAKGNKESYNILISHRNFRDAIKAYNKSDFDSVKRNIAAAYFANPEYLVHAMEVCVEKFTHAASGAPIDIRYTEKGKLFALENNQDPGRATAPDTSEAPDSQHLESPASQQQPQSLSYNYVLDFFPLLFQIVKSPINVDQKLLMRIQTNILQDLLALPPNESIDHPIFKSADEKMKYLKPYLKGTTVESTASHMNKTVSKASQTKSSYFGQNSTGLAEASDKTRVQKVFST